MYKRQLVITTLLSGTPVSVSAEENAEDSLVNIAKNCDVTVPENENAVANMFDDNTQTIWSPATQAGWPATVTFKLPAENTKPEMCIRDRRRVCAEAF